MKKKNKIKDDSLYGLLTVYKSYYTYIKIFASENDKKIVIQLSDNPKNLLMIPKEDYSFVKV